MKKLLLLLLTPCLLPLANCQLPYWQQQVNFNIDVVLNDKEHSLDGFERIEYINNSPDTLKFIWFHLWPNAYKNDRTAYTDQTLENGSTEFYFSTKEQKGYINRLDFKVNNITATLEDHPNHIDIAKLVLPTPLAPGQKVLISTPFHVQLPFNFSRGGHNEQSYQVTQWFPKPAVYDKNGWHPMPYLDQGEYYSDFGNYEVSITLPSNYVVAATGELQEPAEKEWLKTRSAFNWKPVIIKEKNAGGQIKTTTSTSPESATTIKTLKFKQDRVHDFAWFADKRFIVDHDTIRMPADRIVDVYTYRIDNNNPGWISSITAAKKGTRYYSELVGEYPYSVISVVEAPLNFSGGIEYPTITAIAPINNQRSLENVIVHEVGHNWFYGILASNERAYPWLDEGLNSYYDSKYDDEHYAPPAPQLERIAFETKAVTKTDQPINTPSEKFTSTNYNLVAYYKTAEWLRYLESELGRETFNRAMQEYYRRWQFRHPQPEDLKKTFEDISGRNLDSAFSLLDKKGTLPNQARTGTKFSFLFSIKSIGDYLRNPTRNLVVYTPLVGYNMYDKFMAGGLITNVKLPPSKLQFLLLGMYGTASKKISGIGFLTYSHYTNGFFRAIDLGVSAAKFTIDDFKGTDDTEKTYLGFHKIVPGIRLTLRNKDPRSNFNKYIQFKTFLINEDGLRFYRDTLVLGTDTSISTKHRTVSSSRTLNQLQFVIENNRVLYPYRGELKIEQGEDFVRAGFTGNYFFNYPKEGGLNLRLFAGKFFYTGTKTIAKQFATDRYHLNMTGPNGYEDYTYSNLFIGRSEFEGLASQQIMIRDGAFKVRTDLLADKVGKTDDWLIALNLNSSIPSAINPLSMLPVKIPLKLFLDIGTNADAWNNKEENDRFLYDAGMQVSLLKETVNIYIPLLYSNVYKEYIQSTLEKKQRFLKKISFSIDISSFHLRKVDRRLSF